MRLEFSVETKLPPDRVMAALTDFTDNRTAIWPNLDPAAYKVHEVGDGWADVTEGSPKPKVWARERYDWSDGQISWKAVESNFCTVGSGIEMRISPAGTGSRLDVTWERHGTALKWKMMIEVMMRMMGKPMLVKMFREPLDALAAKETA